MDFTIKETEFAQRFLQDWEKANYYQNRVEHWDVKGILNQISPDPLLFDVKARKRLSRIDILFQDKFTWIEGTDIKGNPGWLKGKADYIAFEQENHWLIVNREILHTFVFERLKANGFKQGRGIYEIYTRRNALDKITLVPMEDLTKLEKTLRLKK
tara:strand:+ start:87 stop:554 length:468 start_codon:yes stop_codon:yes gene_type:complete